jgi:hypothetical protein
MSQQSLGEPAVLEQTIDCSDSMTYVRISVRRTKLKMLVAFQTVSKGNELQCRQQQAAHTCIAIAIQALSAIEVRGSQSFYTVMKVVRLLALRTGRLYRADDTPCTYLCLRLSRPQGHSAAGRIANEKFQLVYLESNPRPSGL